MKKKIRINNPGLRFLANYWEKYCTLSDWHEEWARNNITVHSKIQRNATLCYEGDKQRNVYLVARGLLARVMYNEERENRKIHSIATPGMALMTTSHLFSLTPSKGDIEILRSNTLIIEIPYRAIREFNEQEPQLNTLISVLSNKKKNLIIKLLHAKHKRKPFEVYLDYATYIPELQKILTNQESAQLLGISIDTVYRAKRMLLKR